MRGCACVTRPQVEHPLVIPHVERMEGTEVRSSGPEGGGTSAGESPPNSREAGTAA